VGGTAIDELDDDLGEAGAGVTLATLLVACAALSLGLLPVVIALFQPVVALAWAGGVAGSLGAALAVVKLVAMAWGAGNRLLGEHPASVPAALAD
jgi:hypothetical protein